MIMEINWTIDPHAAYFDIPAKNLAEFDAYQEVVFRYRREPAKIYSVQAARGGTALPVFRVPPAIASLLKGRAFLFGEYRVEAKRF